MLEKMQHLALAHLAAKLGQQDGTTLQTHYAQLRSERLGELFPFLVEDNADEDSASEKSRYYVLEADSADESTAILTPFELTDAAAALLPFNKPSGPLSPALGPVIKRTAATKAKDAGPTLRVQETTLTAFATLAESPKPWNAYFRQAHACWTRPQLRFGDQTITAEVNAYQEAIARINERRTVLLAFRTADGRLPGAVPEYVAYLLDTLAQTKYETKGTPSGLGCCALCATQTKVYPNALRGAGFNIANLDRDGAFPGLDSDRAVQSFGLCVACADLLYVYCRHVAPDYISPVAGEKALLLPTLSTDSQKHPEFIRKMDAWLQQVRRGKGIKTTETQLVKVLGHETSVATIDILWADYKPLIEGVRGVITDVLPSRLRAIACVNDQIEQASSQLFPQQPLEDFRYDLSLSILRDLLKRPGGRAAQKSNESRRLWNLRRELAEAIYHRRPLPERFADELHVTARWHWDQAANSDAAVYLLTQEGYSQKKKANFLTIAGWVRQVARFWHYLELVGVSMSEKTTGYQPGVAWLQPYFGSESGLNTPAKAFAFLLGALYGKLLTVQGARGVNVNANAITWLRRLTLSGHDLPELYTKVRAKLLEYRAERKRQIRELNEELARLGVQLGDSIDLDETKTCYFLLLGQALAKQMLPPTKKSGE